MGAILRYGLGLAGSIAALFISMAIPVPVNGSTTAPVICAVMAFVGILANAAGLLSALAAYQKPADPGSGHG